MRSVAEWVGKNDDTAIPPRVCVRIFERAGRKCECCGRPIVGKLRAQYDHKTALVNGGENRESNLQVLCHECHGEKTKQDVAIKARVYVRKKRVAGIRKPSRFACSRNSPWKKKVGGQVVPRERA